MESDAIIVFAVGMNSDGSLSKRSQDRVEKAVELYKKGIAPVLLCSGGGVSCEGGISEAEAMKEFAVRCGVPSNAILVETESLDSLGNIYYCSERYLKPKSWHQVVIVTSNFHEKRVRFILNKVMSKEFSFEIETADGSRSPEVLITQCVV